MNKCIKSFGRVTLYNIPVDFVTSSAALFAISADTLFNL